ncbi:hypothetical protein BCR35DRAFT_303414 [Leucosporidium creatinivorum]|uniref:Uncharacterized protein n=1 Tax=Leucosporidium creatinivorum TaxID=106004 RepID=A0A1Y2FHY2_9BASI|nr:hypothetical protein BCR35DRAFT_303414 [Leucosporidium creatinivorum]
MAFQHPQQRRTTRHVPRQDSPPPLEDSGELATSVDSEVLLFGGQSSNALRLSSAAVPSSATIDQSWALLHNRTQSPTASTQRSSSISTSSSSRDHDLHPPLASPASLTHSLFPSHDGNGIFIAGSLVQSDEGGLGTGATYATEEEGDLDSSLPSGSSALSDTTSSSSFGGEARRGHDGLHAPPGGSVGGSWALTEEALSTVPHATPLGGGAAVLHSGPTSADFTEESSDDESLEGIVVGRRRTPTRRGAGEQQELEDDEVLLSSTPHAASAGMFFEGGRGGRAMYSRRFEGKEENESSRSREAYPSPPPEDAMVGSRIRIKRRHRQSGRHAGSQKRSSASGSIAGAEAVVASPLLLGKTTRRPREVDAQQLEEDKIRRLKAEKDVLFGGVASRLMEIDTATLELVATVQAPPTPEATPTPSRSASPTPPFSTPRTSSPRHHSRKSVHGIQALAQHARDELGDSAMYSLSGGEEEEQDDGDETETEVDHSPKPIQQQWHTSTTPPTLAPRRAPSTPSASSDAPPPRTLSASSLPLYLSNSLAPLTHTNLANSASTLKPPTTMPLIRRTSSYSSSGAVLPGGEENPWGGEFEGFEAAMSYWRRLLRRMRGF